MARGVLAAHLVCGMTGSLCGYPSSSETFPRKRFVNPRTNRFRSYYARSHGVLTVRPVGGRRVRADEALRIGARSSKPQLSAASARARAKRREAESR
jgi:hypothetical protein